LAHIETQREEYKFKSTTIYEQQVINMADSKMAAEEVTATNTTAASGIANDDNDHTYANVPAPAPVTGNADSTTAANTANSNEAAPPSSSTSTDNADGGASASDEPKPKVTNNVDFAFMLDLPIETFIRITMILSMFRTLLPTTFDENELLHKILTLIHDARKQAASSPPQSTTTTTTST